MISVQTACLSPGEMEIFIDGLNHMLIEMCEPAPACSVCKYKRLCDDIMRTIPFIESQIEKRKSDSK